MRFIKISLFFLIISCQGFSQQKELQVNGITVSNITCANIKVTKPIPEISQGFISDIRDAQIIGECLELTVVYGGCNGNLELMTDSVVTKNYQLNFKLRWIEPSLCKALFLMKVPFDLKPYKEFIKEKTAVIKIMGTEFELYYN